MPSSSRHTALPGFIPLAPTVWEKPASYSRHINYADQVPSLIIVLPWTGAFGKHVAKYTNTYETLYPSARILCITTSTKDICLRSSKKKQRQLQPAVQCIRSHVEHNSGHAGILVHVFSEGGSNKAVELAEAYRTATGTKLPCSALCLDSTPGHPHYRRLCKAIKQSLPPIPILNWTGLFVGSALLGGIWMLYTCFKGFENNVISRTRTRLQDPDFWDLSAPRCYLYSEGDELIAWEDVKEHINEAVRSRSPIVEVAFKDSAHCKHAREDPDRYWGAAKVTWKRSCLELAESQSQYVLFVAEVAVAVHSLDLSFSHDFWSMSCERSSTGYLRDDPRCLSMPSVSMEGPILWGVSASTASPEGDPREGIMGENMEHTAQFICN